ncbi:unnamed protein product [Nezara viridula]|uniref:Lysosomal dipeptide transporter MFSD1 n=1 Tax=Nezara viridula TaxID=85310 RepID=A0A9P0MNT1_NEZVI|nr:unnamed protein product [Nezara viridula]
MLNEASEADDDRSDIFLIQGGGCCSPGGACYRYFALAMMCFLGFGSYFCYDNPGALQDVIVKDMSLTTAQFSYLYASYSWPNVILCFVGGFLIDRVFGIRFGTALYAFIVFAGQVVVALGSLFDSFPLMIVGRVIFGIGGESLAVAQNYYAVIWFRGRELNMVFGLQLSFARLGSAVNFIIMEPLHKYVHHYFKGREGLGVSLLIASLTCLISFIAAIGLAWLDKKQKPESNQTEEHEKKDEVKLSDVLDFSPAFWLISVICVAYYIAIFPLIALGKVFFMRKFDLSADDANFVNSMLYIISTIASPLLGLLVDKTGWNLFWVFISICSTIGAHSLLAFTFINPYYAMVLLGVAYSMCAGALWPMVSMVIPEYQLGSAYGVAQACQNFGLAICTMLAGMIVDNGGYLMLEIFFLFWLFVSLIACLCVWFYDMNTTGMLNMTVSQREEYELNKGKNNLADRARAHSSADVSPYEVINPQSDFQIRNRYLSRIGATTVIFGKIFKWLGFYFP